MIVYTLKTPNIFAICQYSMALTSCCSSYKYWYQIFSLHKNICSDCRQLKGILLLNIGHIFMLGILFAHANRPWLCLQFFCKRSKFKSFWVHKSFLDL